MRRGLVALTFTLLLWLPLLVRGGQKNETQPAFQTSDRCVACHNGLITPSGKDVSIGIDWRSTIMGNSSRDPYWQASSRREAIDHPESKDEVEDDCSICHMPITRYEAKLKGKKGEIFSFFPMNTNGTKQAQDGVSCSVCHQVSNEKLGTKESFSGNFVVDAPKTKGEHPEYGPFQVDEGHQHIMQTSTGGFKPEAASHIRSSELCATCHTLYTTARGAGRKELGVLPEQMPFLEWKHSDYPAKNQTCQSCHMPEVAGDAPITAILPVLRQGMHQHVFVGGNFFMQRVLNQYRGDLGTEALPQEMATAAEGTVNFLQSQAARVTIQNLDVSGSTLRLDVKVENLTGHKLPTAFPSRRAWLYVTVRDRDGREVFQSGALNPDGSIQGNDNDADPTKFEPYYREITSGDQVEIFEDILGDENHHVTTGLLQAVDYLKDDRLLPSGFDKQSASHDIAVIGDAAEDANFAAGGDLVRYSVALGNAQGPFHVEAELWYQPIGFRWAHNLEPYKQSEPQRFVGYYNAMSKATAIRMARAEATR
jgi:cytochrome c551/c552